MKTFYTMMPFIENVHLIKDVGMIPYMLYKKYGYDSYVAGYKNCDWPYLNDEVKGLKTATIKKYTGNSIIDGCIWLLENAKKIDILNLYHFRYSTFVWIAFYKLRNHNGSIYLKLDIDTNAGMEMSMKKYSLKWFITKCILAKCKVISAETETFQKHAKMYWPIEIHYIPNGILLSRLELDNLPQKELYILTVGRLGTKQKATEILIQSFIKTLPEIDINWKLILVGVMTEEFKKYLVNETKKHPELQNRLITTGNISDRDILDTLYRKSAIFTMPSRWEGFCLVTLEAASKGDYLLLSDILIFDELVNKLQFGQTFTTDDVEDYAEKLKDICNKFVEHRHLFDNKLIEEIIKQYSWENICGKIYKLLER